eukprot:scaffold3779_cov254-Ochromonas_danica.AAC.28
MNSKIVILHELLILNQNRKSSKTDHPADGIPWNAPGNPKCAKNCERNGWANCAGTSSKSAADN